jgi:hypothetical protein
VKKPWDVPGEFFWDTDPARLDLQQNKQYIIDRILELGDEKAVEWLFSIYSRRDIKRALRTSRSISKKSSHYWNLVLANVGRFDRTKISFFHYPYPLLNKTIEIGGVRIASLPDIGCMKIDAISSRGTKRDFVDLFFILHKLGLDLKSFFECFERKYGPDGFNRHHILKSLVYFEDADKDPEPEMLVDYSWAKIKGYFRGSVVQGFKGFSGEAAPIMKAFGSVDFAADYDYKKARRR